MITVKCKRVGNSEFFCEGLQGVNLFWWVVAFISLTSEVFVRVSINATSVDLVNVELFRYFNHSLLKLYMIEAYFYAIYFNYNFF